MIPRIAGGLLCSVVWIIRLLRAKAATSPLGSLRSGAFDRELTKGRKELLTEFSLSFITYEPYPLPAGAFHLIA
jgi:hypothetical protein